MKNFKKLILVIFLIIPFLTNGCYTVLWTPDEDFPDESNYESYDTYYIDEYHYYYDYPWWLSFTPPYKDRIIDKIFYERNDATNKLRNNGNGRNSSDSRNEVINTPLPTRNSTPPDNGSDNSSGNNNNTNTETKRTESVESNNSNNSRQDSNSNSNNVRNNDGNRNNGKNR